MCNVEHVDLMIDEFLRIKAIVCPQALYPNAEIEQLCDRAIANARQHHPVIVERDEWQRKAEQAEAKVVFLQNRVSALLRLLVKASLDHDTEHDGECWCNPEKEIDSVTGNVLWIHKGRDEAN